MLAVRDDTRAVKVAVPRADVRTSRGRRSDLLQVLEPEVGLGRPCSGCTLSCSNVSHAAGCRCRCSPGCADAAHNLSAEPDRYPIELLVVPIVYELSASGLAQPCWSCEGHNDASGTLYKWPRVWFYASSVTYVELLRAALADLFDAGRTGRAWEVKRCAWQPHPASVMYVLEPCRAGDEPTLRQLHRDLRVLGRTLAVDVRRLAEDWSTDLLPA